MSAGAKAAIAVLKWAAIAMAGVLLFRRVSAGAYEWRGSVAYGGEYLLLLLPLWWWLVEVITWDWVVALKDATQAGNNIKRKEDKK